MTRKWLTPTSMVDRAAANHLDHSIDFRPSYLPLELSKPLHYLTEGKQTQRVTSVGAANFHRTLTTCYIYINITLLLNHPCLQHAILM